ncbi:MAG: hypothetical protein HRT87_02645 [Legionellales bacterium]|nr:hypothetical protein [Legionellales bacterium]
MKRKLLANIFTKVLPLGAVMLVAAGCSGTEGYSESEMAKAKMKQSGCIDGKCTGKSCRDCTKTIYTAKDRMNDEVYK